MNWKQLRHRVTFQKAEQSPDGSGGFLTQWVDRAVVWAAISPLAASREVVARQEHIRQRYEVFVRYRPDLKSCGRIRYGTGLYRVLTVRDMDGSGCWLEFRVELET